MKDLRMLLIIMHYKIITDFDVFSNSICFILRWRQLKMAILLVHDQNTHFNLFLTEDKPKNKKKQN